jgi:hypothetical protein
MGLNVEPVPHLLTLIGILIMKKSKLLIAALLVSCAFLTVPSVAGPGDKVPPVEVLDGSSRSFADWFFDLFSF